MTVLRKDLPGMNESSSALAKLILGNQVDQQQNEQKKNLAVQQAQEMLPIQRQGEQAKSDIDVGAKQQEQQHAIDAVQKMQDSGMANEGGGINVNGVGVTRGFDLNKLAHAQQGQQLHEMQALQKTAKGSMEGPQNDLQTADMIHRLAENPSSVDMGTAQIMKARMAMGGSGGRALGAALRTMGMDDKTLSGDAQSWANFFSGNSTAKQTPQQIDALKEGAFKLGDDATERYSRAKEQFAQQAPFIAPNMAASGQLDKAVPTFTAPADAIVGKLTQRKQDYQKQAAGAATGLNPGPAYKQPQGPIDKLSSWLTGGGQPQAPTQGAAPMSFEDFKKRKAAGQL